MAEATYVRFVSSIEGRLVTRWGARDFLGARRATPAERKAGAKVLTWDTERVIPVTEAVNRKHCHEIDRTIARGDLRARTAEDYKAWLTVQAAREAKHDEELKARKAAAQAEAKPEAEAQAPAEAEAPQVEQGTPGDEPETPPVAKPAPKSTTKSRSSRASSE